MASLSVEKYRRQLEAQLGREDVRKAVAGLRQAHGVFGKYPTTEDLIGLGRPGRGDYEDKDEILAILLAEIKRQNTIFPLLNLILWESLVRIFYAKRKCVSDPEELFARLLVEFYHTAVSYPLDRRPRKIDVNLVLDVKKKLTRWQKEEADFHGRHAGLELSHELRPPLDKIQVSEVFPEEMEAFLLDLAYRRVIDRRQLDLLLEVDVYRQMTEKQWAKARGFAYATVRSWHYRAKTAIQEHVKARREREEEVE